MSNAQMDFKESSIATTDRVDNLVTEGETFKNQLSDVSSLFEDNGASNAPPMAPVTAVGSDQPFKDLITSEVYKIGQLQSLVTLLLPTPLLKTSLLGKPRQIMGSSFCLRSDLSHCLSNFCIYFPSSRKFERINMGDTRNGWQAEIILNV